MKDQEALSESFLAPSFLILDLRSRLYALHDSKGTLYSSGLDAYKVGIMAS